MIEDVGALQDHRFAVHLHRIKPDLDRLLDTSITEQALKELG